MKNFLSMDINKHKIMSLDEEKRNRIIESAMLEFKKGYRKANTDIMTQNASISKGLLFHYFSNKKGLFFFLIHYSLNKIIPEYEKAALQSGDIFSNLLELASIAQRLITKYPLVYSFMIAAFFSGRDEFPDDFADFNSPLEVVFQKIGTSADYSLFRDDIDIQKSIDIIIWATKGFSDNLSAQNHGYKIEDYEPYYHKIQEDYEGYLNLMRKIFYK